VGLKAGRSTAPFLLQVYRRDMGGGQSALMKDLSAPITDGRAALGRAAAGLSSAMSIAQKKTAAHPGGWRRQWRVKRSGGIAG
jgi:hypothetical protein